jgi:hypothetical protein
MSVSIEEKQKSLYAALIRYSSDTQSLRERSIDHLVLIGLQDTSSSNSVRAGDLRVTIGRGVGTGGIRIEYVQESLERLILKSYVIKIELHHRPHYYVSTNGKSELSGLLEESQKIIMPCIDRMLYDFDTAVDRDLLVEVSKKFIINSFVDYGHNIAQCVIGEMPHTDISRIISIDKIFSKSVRDVKLNEEERTGLYSRCHRFIRSQDKKDIEVKFLLTQAYYLAKVFEIDERDFDPLAEDSFKGAIIYLDSNVVFESIFDHDNNRYFDDLISAAKKLGISLHLTQATLDEIGRVLTNKVPVLEKIFSVIPEQLYRNTNDHIVQGYIEFLGGNPGESPLKFIQSIGDIREGLERRGVVYEDMNIEQDFNSTNLAEISSLVRLIACETRGFNKTVQVANHDAAHLMLVIKNRSAGKKSWFLTKDKTLADARLRFEQKRPLFFSISTLVQCISPFAQGSQSDSLFNLFEKVLEDDASLRGVNGLFELSELQIISEYHQDILSTEPEQLNLAFDYVKSTLLNGQEITNKNQHKVSLEIKKFLRCSSDQQKNIMQQEIARKTHEMIMVKGELSEKEELEKDLILKNQQLGLELEENKSKSVSNGRKKLILRAFLALFGTLLSFPLFFFDHEISVGVKHVSAQSGLDFTNMEIIIRVIGSVIFMALLIPFSFCFEKNVRVWILTIAISLSIYFCRLFTEVDITSILTYLSIATIVASYISWQLKKE